MEPERSVKEQFLEDVKDHKLEVLHDDGGVYRHLKFSNNGSRVHRFDLTTWPGHLCISGDMGTAVFARLHDMFEFFRTGIVDDDIRINTRYWREKMVSESVFGEEDDFDEEHFENVVKREFAAACRDNLIPVRNRRDVWEEIESEVLSAGFREDAIEQGDNFKSDWITSEGTEDSFRFSDFWEHDFKKPSVHSQWRMYAIVWGIKQYDVWTLSEL